MMNVFAALFAHFSLHLYLGGVIAFLLSERRVSGTVRSGSLICAEIQCGEIKR